MTPTAFGTLMALEPAIGVLLGLLVLHQKPSTVQIVGILLVVLAGAAAQRGGRRRARPPNPPTPTPKAATPQPASASRSRTHRSSAPRLNSASESHIQKRTHQ